MPPDEVHVTVPNPNGNQLGIRMGSRAIQGPVLGVITLVLIGGLGWLSYNRTQTVDGNFREVKEHLQALSARQDTIRHELQGQTKELLLSTQQQSKDINLELKRQDDLVQEQTRFLRQAFATLLHKLHHPDVPVALDVPLPGEKGR
jgi:hypothetical protein